VKIHQRVLDLVGIIAQRGSCGEPNSRSVFYQQPHAPVANTFRSPRDRGIFFSLHERLAKQSSPEKAKARENQMLSRAS
jgi:hypothetical protein